MVDVVVIGCGPVGALAGVWLGRLGLRTVVVEKTSDVYPLPRAAYVHGDVQRMLDRLGVWSKLGDTTAPVEGVRFVDRDHRDLLHLGAHESGAHGASRPSGFVFHQPTLERTLRQTIDALPAVTLRTVCEATGLALTSDGVDVSVSTGGGATETIRASFVVGCDGAHSVVRRACGIDVEALGRSVPWLVVDARVRHPERLPGGPLQVCDPDQPSTYVPFAGRHRRWEFMLTPAEADLDAHDALARDRLRRWVDPSDLDVMRVAVYRFHALLASRWRHGRIFLAGDAAHQMPPFLGQGMGAGMRDVANLCWKLHAVRDGRAGPHLLETYAAERRPHARAVIQRSRRAGAMIQARHPVLTTLRDVVLRAINEHPRLREAVRRWAARVPVVRSDHVVPPGRGDGATQRVPATTLRDATGHETSLDRVLGAGFAVITCGARREAASPNNTARGGTASGANDDGATHIRLTERPQPPPGAWTDVDGTVVAWMRARGATRAVVRPDGYVLDVR